MARCQTMKMSKLDLIETAKLCTEEVVSFYLKSYVFFFF